jgi:RND family efflux transporter MFP subunit
MEKHTSMTQRLLRDLLRIAVPIGILAAGVAGMVILMRQREAPARVVEEELPPLVETSPAEPHDRGLDLEVDGVVVPYRQVELAAEVDGRIAEKADACRAGKVVEHGTLLLRIDPRDYQLEVDRLAVEAGNTDALIKLAEKQLDLQEKSYQRQQNLHQNRVASDSELDQAMQTRLQAENALLTLRSQLRVLEEQKKKADLDLARTEIRCPDDTDGVIVSDLVEKDDYVRKGSPLVTIEDTSKVEVKCSLRVDELYWLWSQSGLGPGETRDASLRLDYQIPRAPVTVVYRLAGRDYEWQGELSRYEGTGLDESTRTVPCRVVVANPRDVRVAGADVRGAPSAGPPALLRGMFVTIRIHAEPQADLLQIPEAAVRPGNRVWVVRDGKLAALGVRTVRVAGPVAILLAGDLSAGDRVVVTPLASPEDGMAVREKALQ